MKISYTALSGEQTEREIDPHALFLADAVWHARAYCHLREEFRSFAESGWGKIAANLSVRPYGESASLLSYECRTSTTDPGSRRRFLRYWWFIRPFVAHILRATLQQIKDDAEACPPPNPAHGPGSR